MRKQVDNVNHVDSARPGDLDPAERTIDLVHVVMHQFRSLQFQALRDHAHEVTHMESKVMGFFARHPDATVSDLVAHSRRDKAQLAKLVKGLRERQLLEARADTDDRRVVRLRPSAAGRALQQAVSAQGRVLKARAVRGLSRAEQASLVDLLERVKANLDAPE